MEFEHIQSLLQCAGIDVDLKTLQNPTEEFMIYLVTEYLKRLQFDGNEIAKPTPEQLSRVSSEESALNAIKAINLHAALATICEGIFLKDLTLTDITSPGCKKACKRIKVLFNFFVYAKNKRMEKEHVFNELENRQREIISMIDRKAERIAETGSVINDRENKIEYISKAKKEIAQVAKEIEENVNEVTVLQKEVDNVAEIHRKRLNNFNAFQARAHELYKINKDLQTKIVRSPEHYRRKSNELKKMLESKMEERQIIIDCINHKKNQVKINELAEAEVKSCYNKLKDLSQVMQNIKETVMQSQSVRNEIHELRAEISSLERLSSVSKNESTMSLTIDLEKSERLLCELQKSLAEKQKEHSVLEKKVQNIRAECSKLKAELKKERESIPAAENDCASMLKAIRDHFNAELSEELNFRKNLDQLLSSIFI